jgi:hypothetical protein
MCITRLFQTPTLSQTQDFLLLLLNFLLFVLDILLFEIIEKHGDFLGLVAFLLEGQFAVQETADGGFQVLVGRGLRTAVQVVTTERARGDWFGFAGNRRVQNLLVNVAGELGERYKGNL